MKRQVITMQKSTNLSIDEAFSNFIKKSKIRNLSDKTLNTYHNHYKVFSELIDNTTPIADVTSDTLDDFIVYLREQRKVNDVTVNTYLSISENTPSIFVLLHGLRIFKGI